MIIAIVFKQSFILKTLYSVLLPHLIQNLFLRLGRKVICYMLAELGRVSLFIFPSFWRWLKHLLAFHYLMANVWRFWYLTCWVTLNGHCNLKYTQKTQICYRELYLIKDFKQDRLGGNTILVCLGFSSAKDGLHVWEGNLLLTTSMRGFFSS